MFTPTWSLVQYVTESDPAARAGIGSGGVVYTAPPQLPRTAVEILDNWRALEDTLKRLDIATLSAVPGARLVAPITYPRKLLCAGANYSDHAAEMDSRRPDPGARPFFFMKPPTTSIVGTGADVELPRATTPNVDWEVELAVVVADRCKNVLAADALSHVAGYVVANDLSARGLFPFPDAVAPAFAWDWFSHKAPDGFCPLGPGIVPEWMIHDPENLKMSLDVNGVRKQDSSSANLVVGVAGLIAAASHYLTLEPGDVILTGTPAGVGAPRGEFLNAGDLVVAEIESIGRLENRIVA